MPVCPADVNDDRPLVGMLLTRSAPLLIHRSCTQPRKSETDKFVSPDAIGSRERRSSVVAQPARTSSNAGMGMHRFNIVCPE